MKFNESIISDTDISSKIIKGDLEYVKTYFKENPKEIENILPNDKDLVAFAVQADQQEIFDWLLKNGAKARADKSGFSPLHQAALSTNPHYVKELVKFELDINRSSTRQNSPLATLVDSVLRSKISNRISPDRDEKLKRAIELFGTFKTLIANGADIDGTDMNEDYIFMQLVRYGVTPFVKYIVEKDKSLLKQTLNNYNVLGLAMYNKYDDLVEYFLDEDLEIEFADAKIFITNTDNIEVAMKVYDILSEPMKGMIDIDTMTHNDDGFEIMLKLFYAGVKIRDRFIMIPKIKAISAKLLKSDRKDELIEMGVRLGIDEFLPQEAKDIFLF